jgi:hypothetical protein
MLPGGGEKIDELVGRGAQVADAPEGGKRADVKQNSGRTPKLHILIMMGRRPVMECVP